MIDLIKRDCDIQEENEFPKDFSSEEMRTKYNELYSLISAERKMRNRKISKEDQEEADIYNNADAFYEHCREMENYYCSHRSFVEYLNFEKLYALINSSNNEGVYTIRRAFNAVYYMGNLRDFYVADIEALKMFRKNIIDERIVKQGGITRKIALDSFAETIKRALILLGVNEDEM